MLLKIDQYKDSVCSVNIHDASFNLHLAKCVLYDPLKSHIIMPVQPHL